MLLWVGAAFAWSHNGHAWDADAFPLRVCAEEGAIGPAERATTLWNGASHRAWFVMDCDDPHVQVGFDHDDAGPLAQFALDPARWTEGDCAYTVLEDARAVVMFSGEVDWTADVGTAAGTCAGEALQTQLMVRYLGRVLGLDTSPDGLAMQAFETCGTVGLSHDDQVGLTALYAAPRVCDASADAPTFVESGPSGCSSAAVASTGGAAWLLLLGLMRRR